MKIDDEKSFELAISDTNRQRLIHLMVITIRSYFFPFTSYNDYYKLNSFSDWAKACSEFSKSASVFANRQQSIKIFFWDSIVINRRYQRLISIYSIDFWYWFLSIDYAWNNTTEKYWFRYGNQDFIQTIAHYKKYAWTRKTNCIYLI